MSFGKNIFAMAALFCGYALSTPLVFAQTAGTLSCSTGHCEYFSPPPGTTHWEWSMYRIGGGGGVGSPYNCANMNICDFSCHGSGNNLVHITVIATDSANQIIGSVSDTAFCPSGGGVIK